MSSEEEKDEAGQQLTKIDKINFAIAIVIPSLIALIAGLTIPGYLKLAIGSSVLLVFVVLLFLTRAALKKVVRKYTWLGTLIAGTAAGLVIGALVLAPASHTIIHVIKGPQRPGPPPGLSTLTSLMNEEAAAARAHDMAAVSSLYAPAPFVKDAACRTSGSSHTWTGLDQIRARYQALPKFSALRHVGGQVQWRPDNSQATYATMRAQTVGIIPRSASSPKAQYIHGNEVWTFARVGGRWVITSFTYNVCFRPGGGG
jgi:hypothetical protein